jgi:hypothetical protein
MIEILKPIAYDAGPEIGCNGWIFNQTSYLKDRDDPLPTDDVLLLHANEMLPPKFMIFFNHILIPLFPITIWYFLG